jgi:hypothetical protein
MSWVRTIAVDEYLFSLVDGGDAQRGVVVPPDADLTDKAYLYALARAQAAYKFVSAFVELEEYHYGLVKFGEMPGAQRIEELLKLIDSQDFWSFDENKLTEFRLMLNRGYVAARRADMRVVPPPQRKKATRGYVYLVQSPTGYYKIGRTNNPNNRLKTFGVQLPFEIEFVALISTDDMFDLEAQLHKKYETKRTGGEWFALDPADVEYIKGLAK